MPESSRDNLETRSTLEAVHRLNDAVNRHDVDAVMAAMTEDCVFENTYPPPDGTRYEGQAAVRAFWEQFFSASSRATFQFEETQTCGDQCVVRWQYHWIGNDDKAGHIRGVDVFRVRDGAVAEKYSYVKG